MSSSEGRGAVAAELVKGAVAEIASADRAAAGEQLELLEPPTRFAAGDDRRAALEAATRRPGRPPGAANLATARFREHLLRRGVHPLEQLMRWALHTPETLARELACSPLEAFRELRVVWSELAPYFASKVAATDDEGRPVPSIMIALGAGGAIAAPGARPPWLQNQGVSAEPDPVSHGAVSHGVAK